MELSIQKIPGGFSIDGLELRNGKCGCGTILTCCHSWSKVKKSGDTLVFTGKTSSPDTKENFNWGFVVTKGGFRVEVSMEDARDKTIYSGYYPPTLEEFLEKGWEAASIDGIREDFGLWRCAACKWLYKEAEQGTAFDELPDDWKCPVCMAGKDAFERVG